MVYIQVEDVLNGFEEIYKLKQNNWIVNESAKVSHTSHVVQQFTIIVIIDCCRHVKV